MCVITTQLVEKLERPYFFLYSFGQGILAIWPLRTCGDWLLYMPVVILLRPTVAGIYSKPTNTQNLFTLLSEDIHLPQTDLWFLW